MELSFGTKRNSRRRKRTKKSTKKRKYSKQRHSKRKRRYTKRKRSIKRKKSKSRRRKSKSRRRKSRSRRRKSFFKRLMGFGSAYTPNLQRVMGNYRPGKEMNTFQQYLGEGPQQMQRHMAGVPIPIRSNFYESIPK
jgi:hypothetical protein